MNLSISFENFRGFKSQSDCLIRPITLLIGENSSGKTSFMAGTKFFLDFLMAREANFNQDPFYLGTYEQIAHQRGGRAGRAKEFTIIGKLSVNSRGTKNKKLPSEEANLELNFSHDQYQAVISRFVFHMGNDSVSVNFGTSSSASEDSLIIKVVINEHIIELQAPNPFSRRTNSRFFLFFLIDVLKVGLREIEKKELIEKTKERLAHVMSALDSLKGYSGLVVDATSAIRTQPQRTYTPGSEKESGEGGHVPYEIAKLSRLGGQDNSKWRSLKGAIEDFGAQSGMFGKIHVRSLGQKNLSDPFQLQFTLEGPKMNLVDLGYGTSQVLPILYFVARARRGQYVMIQQPEVHLHPKAQATLGQFLVDFQKSNEVNFVIETHSDYIVDRVRSAVRQGNIQKDDVSILFFKRERLENKVIQMEINSAGDFISQPDEYRSFFINEKMRLLGL